MAELSNLDAGAGDGDRTAGFQAVEEPLLHRVVVQRPVDVDGPYGGPVDVPWLQQALCVELPLVPALRVNGISLQNPPNKSQTVRPGASKNTLSSLSWHHNPPRSAEEDRISDKPRPTSSICTWNRKSFSFPRHRDWEGLALTHFQVWKIRLLF